jgi:hypothetical protein
MSMLKLRICAALKIVTMAFGQAIGTKETTPRF